MAHLFTPWPTPCPSPLFLQMLRLPTEEARQQLGLSKNGFRLVADAHGYKKWPQRQLVGLDKLLEQASSDRSLSSTAREVRLRCGAVCEMWGVTSVLGRGMS